MIESKAQFFIQLTINFSSVRLQKLRLLVAYSTIIYIANIESSFF